MTPKTFEKRGDNFPLKFNMLHLKISPKGKRRFRTWKASCSGSMFNFGGVDLSPNDGYSSQLCQKVKVLIFHNRWLLCWNSLHSRATKNKRTSKVLESIMVKQRLERDGWLSYCSYLVRIYWLEWRGIGVLAKDWPWFWTRWFGIRSIALGAFVGFKNHQSKPLSFSPVGAKVVVRVGDDWYKYLCYVKCICANFCASINIVYIYIQYMFFAQIYIISFGNGFLIDGPLTNFLNSTNCKVSDFPCSFPQTTHWSLLVPPKKKNKPETVDPSEAPAKLMISPTFLPIQGSILSTCRPFRQQRCQRRSTQLHRSWSCKLAKATCHRSNRIQPSSRNCRSRRISWSFLDRKAFFVGQLPKRSRWNLPGLQHLQKKVTVISTLLLTIQYCSETFGV